MFVSNLKRIFVILLISVSALPVKAQQIHFIYVQTENGQPFYVRFNNKVVSSSPAGYVILPNLSDGDYQLAVGFPKNEFPEEGFRISIDKKNEGFLLKNFGEKGWGLFNMQSLALLSGANSKAVVTTTKIQDDPFSKMLASVVKDSSLLQKNEPVFEVKETPVLQKNVAVNDTPVNKIAEQQPLMAPPITKLLSKNAKDGMEMIYVDRNDNNSDTIRVFIPEEKIQSKKTEDKIVVDENKNSNAPYNTTSSHLTITPTIVKPDTDTDTVTLINDTIRVFKELVKKDVNAKGIKDSSAQKNNEAQAEITITEPVKNKNNTEEAKDSTVSKNNYLQREETITLTPPVRKYEEAKIKRESEIIVLPKVVTSSKVNSDCKAFATDEDFLKLRKKMAAENNNDDMIRVAKKIFRTKCFSTEQIKNLSFLFLTEEGKYIFLDAAYAYASDSDQYHLLESQLSDEYYINRFNAMIHN